MTMKAGYAVIGSDGIRLVIWGVGDSRVAAREDAVRWLNECDMGADAEFSLTETVAITAEQRERHVDSGELNPVTLGILTRDDAARIGRRFAA